MTDASPPWRTLGDVAPEDLVEARLELHWAAQVPAAFGARLAEQSADHGHLSLTWSDAHKALLSQPARRSGLRAGLVPGERALLLCLPDGSALDTFPLRHATLGDAHAWLEHEWTRATGEELELPLLEHELPAHPIGDGAPFGAADPQAAVELAHWFANAAVLCGRVAAHEPHASPVRVWPHHFDLATLIALDRGRDPEPDPERARTIGVGLSPGDASYAEPYLYVTPWPYPTDVALPALPHGAWHTQGWVGAVLRGSELLTGPRASQAEHGAVFFAAALAAARALLHGAPRPR